MLHTPGISGREAPITREFPYRGIPPYTRVCSPCMRTALRDTRLSFDRWVDAPFALPFSRRPSLSTTRSSLSRPPFPKLDPNVPNDRIRLRKLFKPSVWRPFLPCCEGFDVGAQSASPAVYPFLEVWLETTTLRPLRHQVGDQDNKQRAKRRKEEGVKKTLVSSMASLSTAIVPS